MGPAWYRRRQPLIGGTAPILELMDGRRKSGLGSVFWAIGLCAMVVLGGASAYFAYSTRLNGGAPYSGFEVTLTRSTTHIVLPKGDSLVVIPMGIDSSSSTGFQPSNLKVALGVNNTILFVNEDSTEHIVQPIVWPAGSPGWDLWLVQGANATVTLNATGTYIYNFELTQSPTNGTITVVSA